MTRVQILDEAVWISHCIDIQKKAIQPIILPQAIGSRVD